MRSGLIVKKLGMTRILDDKGQHIPATLLKLDSCEVLAIKSPEKHGYRSVVLATQEAKVKNLSRALRQVYAAAKIEPKRIMKEFRVSDDMQLEQGQRLLADHFIVGQYVDVSAVSIGKGFAGAMKRHNFAGLRASHGVSIAHRSHGSTGQCQDPGKVFKGKKMAGHMGARKVTIQGLKVLFIDTEQGLIAVKGAVPGASGATVCMKDAVKRPLPENVPKPASTKAA